MYSEPATAIPRIYSIGRLKAMQLGRNRLVFRAKCEYVEDDYMTLNILITITITPGCKILKVKLILKSI